MPVFASADKRNAVASSSNEALQSRLGDQAAAYGGAESASGSSLRAMAEASNRSPRVRSQIQLARSLNSRSFAVTRSLEHDADEIGAGAINDREVFDGQPPVQRSEKIIGNSAAPVQRTRADAENVGAWLTGGNREFVPYLLDRDENNLDRLKLMLINNHGLLEDDPNYFRIQRHWFPNMGREEFDNAVNQDITEDPLFAYAGIPFETSPTPLDWESSEIDIEEEEAESQWYGHKRKFSLGSGGPEKEERKHPERKKHRIATSEEDEDDEEGLNEESLLHSFRSTSTGTSETIGERSWKVLGGFGAITEIEEIKQEQQEPQPLGLVSWNVAHFSNKDIGEALQAFSEQFETFSGKDWRALFIELDEFAALVNTSLARFKRAPTTVSSREEPQRSRVGRSLEKRKKESEFESDETLRQEHKKTFGGLKGDVELTLLGLTSDLENVRNARSQINAGEYEAEIDKVVRIDWEELWERAKSDRQARIDLADKVKQLRKFENIAEPAKKIITVTKKLLSASHLQTLLSRIAGEKYGELLTILSDVAVKLPRVGTINELGRALHSFNIATHIEEMFKNNEWLDLLALQEVNDPSLLKQTATGYDLYSGPHLVSGGENPQQEFYPLLVRKGSNIRVESVFVVITSGLMTPVGHDQTEYWDKEGGIYRPIVVYQIRKGDEKGPTWIAIVHTTPEPDTKGEVAEFNRRAIFKEVEAGLKTLEGLADQRGIPLIIGGDYYLTSEALVKDLAGESLTDVGLDFNIEDIKAKTKRLRTILQYLLAKEEEKLRAQSEEQEEQKSTPVPVSRPEGVSDREIADAEQSTQRILEIERGRDAVEALRERIKFLNEALTDDQLLKNFYGLTVKHQIEELGLLVAQSVTGTNPKKDPLGRWFDLQIADFFIHNEQWKSVELGIVRPEGKLLTVDTEERTYSRYWQRFSDHFPVGGLFSLGKENLRRNPAFVRAAADEETALELNTSRFAELEADRRFGFKDRSVAAAFIGLMKPSYRAAGAVAYLKRRYEELVEQAILESDLDLFDISEPQGVKGYIEAIERLEDSLELDEEDRLLLIRPEDFEPDYDEGETGKGSESKKRRSYPERESTTRHSKEELSDDEYELTRKTREKGKQKKKEKGTEKEQIRKQVRIVKRQSSFGSKFQSGLSELELSSRQREQEENEDYDALSEQRDATEANFLLEQGGQLIPENLAGDNMRDAIQYLGNMYRVRLRTRAQREEFIETIGARYSEGMSAYFASQVQTDTPQTRAEFYRRERDYIRALFQKLNTNSTGGGIVITN